MGASYQDYFGLLRDLSGLMERLAGLAEQKAAAVRQDDLIALDEVLKQEQALGLNLRGLEQRRMKLASQLGLAGTKLDDLPGKCPPELEMEARKTVEGVRYSYEIFRSCADMARNTLELNLHQIDKLIAASGVEQEETGRGYQAPGVEPPKNMKTDFRA